MHHWRLRIRVGASGTASCVWVAVGIFEVFNRMESLLSDCHCFERVRKAGMDL